jgi:ribosomal protein S27AE
MIEKDGKDRDVITEDKRKCPRCRSIMVSDGMRYTCMTCDKGMVDFEALGDKFDDPAD